jgi:Asp-tRNA(Asn)/Glu-tRNA(Gln) amidotransferase A subunit family amidase
MARCVHDLRLLLPVMAGYDSKDPHSSNSPAVDLLEPGPLNAVNIGVIRGDFVGQSQADVVHAFELAGSAFDAAGATLCEIELPHSLGDILKHHEAILAAEVTIWHRSLFEKFSAQYPPKLAKLIKEARLLPPSAYAEAKAFQLRFRSEIESLLKNKCDVLLTPSAPSTALLGHQSTGDPAFNAPWSFSGHPTVVFPAGLGHNGLPTSIQFIGLFMRERQLLRVAEWCEAALAGCGNSSTRTTPPERAF